MRRINRRSEPQFWADFVRKNPKVQYRDLGKTEEGKELRRKIRKYMTEEQYWLCAYCCGKINLDNSLNEHILPEDGYPNRSMEYLNLVVSCREKKTCGSLKGSKYNEALFVSPLDDDCEEQFAYAPNGEIIGLTEKGRYTIDLLGLNVYELKEARKATCQAYQWCDDESIQWYLQPQDGRLIPYVNILEYFYRQGYFEN